MKFAASMALAGAVGGAGKSLVDRANERRESALLNLKRQWDIEDQERSQQFALDRMGQQNAYATQAREAGWAREDAQRAASQEKLSGVLGGMGLGAATDKYGFGAKEQEYGLPTGYLARTAQIESTMNPGAKNPNSTASGLFQFLSGTAKQYGLSDPFDPVASTDAAARLARDNANTLRKTLGRDPTAGELYLAHQQGGAGAAKLLRDPNARAIDIVGIDAIRLNGGRPDMSAGEFAGLWLSKFGEAAAPRQGPSADDLAGFLLDDGIPAAARADIWKQITGQKEEPKLGGWQWVDDPNDPEQQILMGQSGDSQQFLPALGKDGEPLAKPKEVKAPTLSSTADTNIEQLLRAEADRLFSDDALTPDVINAFKVEAVRVRMANPDWSEAEVIDDVFSRATREGREEKVAGSGFLGMGKETRTVEDGMYTGGFRMRDGEQGRPGGLGDAVRAPEAMTDTPGRPRPEPGAQPQQQEAPQVRAGVVDARDPREFQAMLLDGRLKPGYRFIGPDGQEGRVTPEMLVRARKVAQNG